MTEQLRLDGPPEPISANKTPRNCGTCKNAKWWPRTLTPAGRVGTNTRGACGYPVGKPELPSGCDCRMMWATISALDGKTCKFWEKQ